MEGQVLRDEIARVGMSMPSDDRPPALAFAVDRVEREAQQLTELAQLAEDKLGALLHPAPDVAGSDTAIPERTGVRAPDRILDLADQLRQARLQLASPLDRVGV